MMHDAKVTLAGYWFALRVQPQREFAVEKILERRGIRTFLPCSAKWILANRYHRGRKKLVERVLMPGYVLVNLAPPVNWLEIRKVHLITGVVGIDGVPMVLPPEGVERMSLVSSRIGAKVYHRAMPTNRTFEAGDVVEVLDGPLELVGATVKVVEIEGPATRIFHRFFGTDREITVPTSTLGAIE